MNQDLSVSAFSPEFSFENVNMRLSTNSHNTLMSWVNERGTKRLTIIDASTGNTLVLRGIPVGTAILNHQLVLFTTTNSKALPLISTDSVDRIYVLRYEEIASGGCQMRGSLLFSGSLNLSSKYPLETLVSYEAEHIQKVYWTDGRNQPRVINIAADSDHRMKWRWPRVAGNSYFDFVPVIRSTERVRVSKNVSTSGTFAPGVIQYCFTYVNTYGQQSNVVWVSDLQYLSHSDRGASPEDRVNASFTLSFDGLDTSFDAIRIYSVQRTFLNGEVMAKLIDILPLNSGSLTYTDTGTVGSSISSTELLYAGGREITVLTMSEKDGTLFMGNLSQKNSSMSSLQSTFDSYRKTGSQIVQFMLDSTRTIPMDDGTGVYDHTLQLDKGQGSISTFKGGEWYRFGFQLQKHTGEWMEPVFIDDLKNEFYPYVDYAHRRIEIPYAWAFVPLGETISSSYRAIRPVVVYPTIGDREVLCQGVINPTVFNAKSRLNNSPFAQASWYYRPYMVNGEEEGIISIDIRVSVQDTIPSWFNPSTYKDEDAYRNDRLEDVYVLVADFPTEDKKNKVLESGYISVHEWDYERDTIDGTYPTNINEYRSIYFNRGAIRLGNTRVAFISDKPWPKEYSESGIDEHDHITYDRGFEYGSYLQNILRSDIPFKWYSGMEMRSTDYTAYYRHYEDYEPTQPPTYTFYFYVKDDDSEAVKFYSAVFTAVSDDASYIGNMGWIQGSSVPFTHYDSLACTDVKGKVNPVEIENSIQSYSSVFDSSKAGVNSNTQFFVDQSIVTLNSPDLEFDTSVQSYGSEGLGLRIVGYVPITSSVSCHHIDASARLEANHNNGYSYDKVGAGELNQNVYYTNYNGQSQFAGRHLVTEALWSDVEVIANAEKEDGIITNYSLCDYPIYPWQKTGSLNNDFRGEGKASSWLKVKQESNLLYSLCSSYLNDSLSFSNISIGYHFQENEGLRNYRLPKQMEGMPEVNYYPNVDSPLYNYTSKYDTLVTLGGRNVNDLKGGNTGVVSMKYQSGTHAVIAINDNGGSEHQITIMPAAQVGSSHVGLYSKGSGNTFWGSHVSFYQNTVTLPPISIPGSDPGYYNFLWLGELYKKTDNPNRFGGKTPEALQANKWQVAGEAVPLNHNGMTEIRWTIGDTYFQRYDSLKTYAYTKKDTNQLVEILSFMCESRVNIDGRYDKQRGQMDNTAMSPENFNLLNHVYSQQNNYFTYMKQGLDTQDNMSYPNQIAYSLTKQSGADIDQWTNVTLGSVLELDGDKGSVNSLQRFNNQLIAFQDSGVSQVLYNENVQISTADGVPIEIANSGKLQGKRYLSSTIGCSNKWSVVNTPSGIYFMDSNNKSIYKFDGQFTEVSASGGMNTWAKQHIPDSRYAWSPDVFSNYVSYYDALNQDVLFIGQDKALAWSEKLGSFTSFYDYGYTPYFCNLEDIGLWVRQDSLEDNCTTSLWQHQEGGYCNFFDSVMPYSMTFVGNPEPTLDKTFTNVEFRAVVDGEGTTIEDRYHPYLPFDELEVWNEYQHGISYLQNKYGHPSMQHHLRDNTSALKRKFRIWRCDIPRDNADNFSVFDNSFDRSFRMSKRPKKPIDRMRNPWIYMKLKKYPLPNGNSLDRMELHDMVMTYYT